MQTVVTERRNAAKATAGKKSGAATATKGEG